jgi:hypothetical protein
MTNVSFRLYSGDSPRTVCEKSVNTINVNTSYSQWREAASNENSSGDAVKISANGAIMDNDSDTVGGYAVPVDPMDMLQCDSCQ